MAKSPKNQTDTSSVDGEEIEDAEIVDGDQTAEDAVVLDDDAPRDNSDCSRLLMAGDVTNRYADNNCTRSYGSLVSCHARP